jgi:serine/threonine-protein kinase
MDTRRRAEDVFEVALELDPAKRSEYVGRVCESDGQLKRQVLELLDAYERAEGILELDPGGLMRNETEPVPERLGAYRIVREIGRGGMGVVYEAERADGQFLRRVAIKLLRGGQDPALRQRVLAERQILATLEHPDIARLLDGGVTGDGRPYLVMEHVEGLPVDVFCDRMRLSIPERLRLFTMIGRAVAYAHRNLVVHRDLKPSNIMVTADGRVKLLDFGIAKLLHPALRGVAADTLPGRLAFTPEYASPEQLRGDALTTVSDVYALGVLLYELLAGRRPFAASGLGPLLRAVSEDEPERPSTRVLRSEMVPSLDGGTHTIEAEAVARARHTTPARLARTLRGDLDAIVALALCKEPQRRYGSAELLVEDIERTLDGRPVLAQRRGRAYAFAKLVRRHRTVALALALGAISLLVGSAAALWQAAAAREQRDQAQAARAQAEQVTEFMVDLFQSAAPGVSVQGTVSARDLVRRGNARIDELSGQPLVQASMLDALARAYEGLGDYEEAQRLTQRALTIHESQSSRDETAVASLLFHRGILQRSRSEFDSAQATFFAARAAVERGPAAPKLRADILQQLASIAIYRGDAHEAERRSIEAWEQQLRELGETHRATVSALANLASVQWRRGKLEAEATFRRVLELRARQPDHTRIDLMKDQMGLATMLVSEALRLDEAEAICRSVIAATSTDSREFIDLAVWSRHLLAAILEHRSDFAGSERLHREDLAIRRAINGDQHPGDAETLMVLANFLKRRGRFAEADTLLRQSGNIIRQSLGEQHMAYAGWLTQVGLFHLDRGDARAAEDYITRSMRLREQLVGRSQGAHLVDLPQLALVKIRLREFEAAEQMLQQALELGRMQYVEGGRVLRGIHAAFAQLYTAWGRHAKAEQHRALSLPAPIPT